MRPLLLLATTLFVGCGIPGSTPMLDLTEDDGTLICDHIDYEDSRTVSCDNAAGDVEVVKSTYDDCIAYFTAVRTIQNPACTGDFEMWKACKTEDSWLDDDEMVCAVYGAEIAQPAISEDCQMAIICATPVE